MSNVPKANTAPGKLSEEDRQHIRELRSQGKTLMELAFMYGVSINTIQHHVRQAKQAPVGK